MIRFISIAAITAALFAVGAVAAGPAAAGGYYSKHHHGHYDGHPGYHYPRIPFVYELGRVIGAFLPHGHHSYRRGHYDRGHHYYRRHRSYAPPAAYRPYAPQHYYSHGGGCHPVTKTEYYYGRLAKIGGTMCYDAYGTPYVVPGSRYVMHFYD